MSEKILLVALALVTACGGEGQSPQGEAGLGTSAADQAPGGAAVADALLEGPPPAVSPELAVFIGEYAADADTFSILEDGGQLYRLPWGGERIAFGRSVARWEEVPEGVAARGVHWISFGDTLFSRLSLGADGDQSFTIDPVRPPEELRAEALAATPPEEEGDFLPPDLVEAVTLDSTMLLDVRYAGTNNFMGEVFYSSPRVFLQRPAAEALIRASDWLRERGYGLLLHDGYRPWYVTKMFWDATPEELKVFVADPASGSRHNRGCAVDLTLYDLQTGEPVLMPGGYDEMSPRSYVDYQGGTGRQRWFRELLRAAMEAQGFEVYPAEWWHFDHRDWRRYRIQNLTFEEIRTSR